MTDLERIKDTHPRRIVAEVVDGLFHVQHSYMGAVDPVEKFERMEDAVARMREMLAAPPPSPATGQPVEGKAAPAP